MNTSPDTIARILVGVDASENSVRAADWAASLAVSLGARLTLAHALDLPDTDPSARSAETSGYRERRHHAGERILSRMTTRISERHPGLTVDTELSAPDPAQALALLAQDADLLVTGTRGHGGFTGMLLGSVSNKLAAHAPCPVIVIGVDTAYETSRELVLGLGEDDAPAPIEFAFRIADLLGLSVRTVRVFEPVVAYGGYHEQAPQAVADDLDAALEPVRKQYPNVPATVEPRQGVPVPTLVQAALSARLLVVGSHRSRGPLSFGPGHIVHGLLSYSVVPVAVVPIQ